MVQALGLSLFSSSAKQKAAGWFNAGWYNAGRYNAGWYNHVTLDASWTNPKDWGWHFEHVNGGESMGAAPNLGHTFYNTSLVEIPEPGTLLMLTSGGLGLLALAWLRRR